MVTLGIGVSAVSKQSIRLLTLIYLFGALERPSLACANDYSSNLANDVIYSSQSLAENLRHVVLKEPWITRRERLRKAVEAGGDYKIKNDYAVALMHTGDPKTAVQIL